VIHFLGVFYCYITALFLANEVYVVFFLKFEILIYIGNEQNEKKYENIAQNILRNFIYIYKLFQTGSKKLHIPHSSDFSSLEFIF
jgi:hypothetical protein